MKIRTGLDAELDDAVFFLEGEGYDVSRAAITARGLRWVLDQIKSEFELDEFPRRPQRRKRYY